MAIDADVMRRALRLAMRVAALDRIFPPPHYPGWSALLYLFSVQERGWVGEWGNDVTVPQICTNC